MSGIYIIEAERLEEVWWAIGAPLKDGAVRVRRIVKGRLLARAEKRKGERITPALVIVAFKP